MVNSAVFSPDGAHILTANGAHVLATYWDGTARLSEATTGKEVVVLQAELGVQTQVTSAKFSSEGADILTVTHNHMAPWEAATEKNCLVFWIRCCV